MARKHAITIEKPKLTHYRRSMPWTQKAQIAHAGIDQSVFVRALLALLRSYFWDLEVGRLGFLLPFYCTPS